MYIHTYIYGYTNMTGHIKIHTCTLACIFIFVYKHMHTYITTCKDIHI